jgi:hypothetical protein
VSDEKSHARLNDRQARGGVIGGKGYGFQAAYIVSRIPIWLDDPDFVQFIQHDQGRGHHVGEVRCFLQALQPGAPAGLQHGCGDVVWVFSLSGQHVEGDDISRSSIRREWGSIKPQPRPAAMS